MTRFVTRKLKQKSDQKKEEQPRRDLIIVDEFSPEIVRRRRNRTLEMKMLTTSQGNSKLLSTLCRKGRICRIGRIYLISMKERTGWTDL